MAPKNESILTRYFYPIGFSAMGVLTVVGSNYHARRPHLAGIQRHIALGTAGLLFGIYFDKYLDKKYIDRDARIRHYIELHPEDFEDKKRKYKEVFDYWIPCR